MRRTFLEILYIHSLKSISWNKKINNIITFFLDFRTSKTSIHKSKEKLSADGAEEKLLQKEDEAKIITRVDMADAKYVVGDHRNGDAKIELDANKKVNLLFLAKYD